MNNRTPDLVGLQMSAITTDFAAFANAKADLLSTLAGQNEGRRYACKISKTDHGTPFLQVLEDGEAILIATETPRGGVMLAKEDGKTPVAWGVDLTAAFQAHTEALKCLGLTEAAC